MTTFKTTEVKTEDLQEISDLVNSAYRGDSSKKGWTTEADLLGGQRTDPGTLGKQLAEHDRRFLCVREEGSPKIIAVVSLEKREQGKSCYLGMLTVQPTRQADGIGRYLLEESERYAKKWGAEKMTMSVIQLRPELIAWYERRGYKKTGETAQFPYGDKAFGLPKRDDIHFLILAKPL